MLRYEGIDVDKIPQQLVELEVKRHKVESSQTGPITRKAFFMAYGRLGIVAEAKYDSRRRHLNF